VILFLLASGGVNPLVREMTKLRVVFEINIGFSENLVECRREKN
jgi:hypothetical protein